MITKWTDIESFEVFDSGQMNDYQRAAASTAIYKQEHAVIYPALGLAAEAGEVANKVKKILRDGNFDREAIADEVGDCLWYIAALCRDLNVDMQDIANNNIKKLKDRQERGVLSGSGDKR
jgi:NTP pyrophosphatase (non-canonical NTP hydrolase)|tara:strand:+ start:736 stop:1095 length:360 start_codon:yes stop_codon:yes gene_type:complete